MNTPTGVRDVARRRLAAQHLVGEHAVSPAEVVRHLGAVQAQEFASARWSLGQRSGADDAAVSAAYDRGEFLRTHLLRPTWHFVLPEDLHWIQALTSERVRNQDRYGARRAGVDEELVGRSRSLFERALTGGRDLTRAELKEALAVDGLDLSGPQLGHLTLRAEVDDVLTSGPMRGRLHTYMLVEERVGTRRRLDGDEALAELTRRYFRSHGPASEKDFAWWSSLLLSQVRRGLQIIGGELERVTIDETVYWFDPTSPSHVETAGALMLQTFDELVVAYTQTRRVAYDEQPARSTNPNTFAQPLVVDGQVVGTWRAKQNRGTPYVEIVASTGIRDLVAPELARYERFRGSPHPAVWVDSDAG